MLRYLWNGLRYHRWTNCCHLIQITTRVRQASPVARPAVEPRGEVWTICHTCGAVLRRASEQEA